MRISAPALAAGVVIAVVGVAGLVRGVLPEHSDSSTTPASAAQPIVVSGAYVHPNIPPTTTAAAYFTIDNTTSKPDRLISVTSGAGASAVLHTTMKMSGGSMMMTATSVTVPAHGSLRFRPGGNHVMIEQVLGRLKPGGTVNFELDFADAGSVDITAPVVPLGTDSPTVSHATHGGHS